MSDQSALLAVIPARGGSRGIPRKVLQPVDGVPLLLRTLRTVEQSRVAARLVVSTEDAEIAAFARLRGYEVLDRPAELASDTATLAAVVKHAVEALEWDGLVGVFQPTCPLLRPETIEEFVWRFAGAGLDWAISSVPARRITWGNGQCLSPRANRQDLPGHICQESGAVQVMTADYARVPHGTTGTFPILEDQALDIDTHADLAAARQALGRRRIEFRVVASAEKGLGHVWRCLQLSDALAHHNVCWSFGPEDCSEWATRLLDQRGIAWWPGRGGAWPDLLVVDALDAAEVFVPAAKAAGSKVVVFEHDGPACRMADLVVDEFADPRWTILRPEFTCLPAKLVDPDRSPRVLVTFGGTDPAGLNGRIASTLAYALDAEVRAIAGPGAEPFAAGKATIVEHAVMSEEMCWADVVVTGQGRTVAEAVACGTPVVSVAANERESRHARLPGVLYLGLWAAVSDEALVRTVSRLLERPKLRAEMAETARASIDGKGVERIVHQIEGLLRGL